MDAIKFWPTVKQTLLEKNGDTVMGSIKRWGAWILFTYAGWIILAGLIPAGQMHFGTFLELHWNHGIINLDALKELLTAIGTYILTGQLLSNVTDTIQNYHDLKLTPKTPPTDAPKV